MDLGDVLLKLVGHPGGSLPAWLSGTRLHPLDGANASFQSRLLHFLSLWVLPPQTPVAPPHLPQPQLLSLNIIQRCFKPFFFFPPVFPCSSDGKKSACMEGDPGDPCSIAELGRSPGDGNGNPLQYSCLENPHEQRSLAGLQSMGLQRVGHDWATTLSCKPF